MASELKVDKFTGVTTAGSILVTGEGNSTTTNLQQGLAKAWLTQSQNNTINDSLNISGLTDNAVGDCTFAFTSAMNSTNHVLLGVMQSGGNSANIMLIHGTMSATEGRCRFGNYAGSGSSITLFDDNNVKNATWGDLA